jgi:hypothetical protein
MMVTAACLSGCIEHEARLDPPDAPAESPTATPVVYVTKVGTAHGNPFSRDAFATAPISSAPGSATAPAAAPAPQPLRFAGTVSTGPLPISLGGDSWVRDQDGNLYRGSAVIETPLSWYQRFPIDFATDLWPGTVAFVAAGAPVLHPVAAMPADDLTAEARANGYCHDQRPTAAGGVHAR